MAPRTGIETAIGSRNFVDETSDKSGGRKRPLSQQAKLRAELAALRLLVDRMLLVQARNLGKEAYLEDLRANLRLDMEFAGGPETSSEVRAVMDAAIDRSIESVRAQLLLARADSSKRN